MWSFYYALITDNINWKLPDTNPYISTNKHESQSQGYSNPTSRSHELNSIDLKKIQNLPHASKGLIESYLTATASLETER